MQRHNGSGSQASFELPTTRSAIEFALPHDRSFNISPIRVQHIERVLLIEHLRYTDQVSLVKTVASTANQKLLSD